MFVTQRCSPANARRLKRAKGSAVRPSEIKTRLILTEGDEVVLDDLEQNMTLVKCKDYLPLCPLIIPSCLVFYKDEVVYQVLKMEKKHLPHKSKSVLKYLKVVAVKKCHMPSCSF